MKDILHLFNELDEKCEWNTGKAQCGEIVEAGMSEEDLVHIEGTVIHYFSFAVKQDPGLGFDILKILKARQYQLSPFEVALLLSLYKVQRYESKIFEILKKAVECEYTHDFQRSVSPWIESLHDLVSPTAMSSVMKSVLRRSGKGWEHIMNGFVGFALNLMMIFSKRSSASKGLQGDSHGGVANFNASSLTSSIAIKGISKHVVIFSLQLLERAFRKHDAVRNEILSNIFSGVISRDDSSPYFVQLLSKIATTCCHDVMDCIGKVKDTLEYISFMPPSTAVSLVRALQPVLRAQTSLQDFFQIVLRKSLFSRELDSRLVTLECLLFIAETSCPSASQRHASTSQSAIDDRLTPSDTVAIEIISQIRRCMSQQVQLRQKLYDGLTDLVKKKPYLADYIMGILLPQIDKYIVKDGDGVVSQINLHGCIDESGDIIEPFAHLLRTTVNCLIVSGKERSADDLEGFPNILQARPIIESIATFVSATELAEFELERHSDFEKPQVLHLAKLLSNIYEVCLEFIAVFSSFSLSTWTKRFFSIIERSRGLSSLLKEHSKAAKGRKSSASTSDDKNTLLSYQFTGSILAVVGDKIPKGCAFDQATCTALFGDVQCMGMVLHTALMQESRST